MKSSFGSRVRKRPVNLTLSEDLVGQARQVTDNLSAVVEGLLSDYLKARNLERRAKARLVESSVKQWNEFGRRTGSLADDYSTL